jgi:cbb3-type cytochrome oxidase subunit 3
MWVLMLEAFVALFLLVFIVWWTLPAKKKPAAKQAAKPLPGPDAGGKDDKQA